MTAQTPAQRKAAERARKRKAGLVKVEFWAKKKNVPAIKTMILKLDKS